MRLTVTAVIGVLATLLAMAAAPGVAFAQSGITIISAGPNGGTTSQVQISVEFGDSNGGVTAVDLHVLDDTSTDVPGSPFTMSPVDTSNQSDQIWSASVPSASLPAGTYSMAIDVTDSSGPNPDNPAGSFAFPYTTAVSVTPSQDFASLGADSITFSGSVTGTLATDSNPAPLTGVPVDLTINGAESGASITTDGNGNFSYTVSNIPPDASPYSYVFSVAGTDTYSADSWTSPQIPFDVLTTNVNASAAPASVSEGAQDVTFSGTVQGTLPGLSGPVNIDNATVMVSGPGVPSGTSVQTDNNGDFTYPDPAAEPGSYDFSVAATSEYGSNGQTVSVGATSATTAVTVSPASPVVTEGTPDVTFSGTVSANNGASAPPVGTPVYLTIGTGPTNQVTMTDDANGDYTYTPPADITAGAAYVFSVQADPNGLYGAGSATSNVQVDQAATSVTKVIATPNNVGVGSQNVVFTGTVTAKTQSGKTVPVTGATVDLVIGKSTTATAFATTDSNGNFTGPFNGAMPNDYTFSVGGTILYTTALESISVGLNQATTDLAVKANPAVVTEGSQTVTFSGKVTGVVPGGTSAAIAGVPIDLTVVGAKPRKVATTASDGTFSYKVAGISGKGDYTFSIASTSSYTMAKVQVPVDVDAARTRIIGIRVRPGHLKYGQKATMRGTVEYRRGTTWVGLAGASVHLRVGASEAATIKTKADGSFSDTVSTTRGPGWTATLAASNLAATAAASGKLTIEVPMRVRAFNARLSTLGDVNATGCLQVSVPYNRGPSTSIEVQYSAGTHGPWKNLGLVALHNVRGAPAACHDTGESYFDGSLPARNDNAYYRAYFKATYSFDSVLTKSVHAWRYQTRITGFDVHPRSVANGGTVKITGRLWRKVGKSWRPYSGRTVVYPYHVKNTTYWSNLGHTKTSSDGYFVQDALASAGHFVAVIYAQYSGGSDDLYVRSGGIDITVGHSKASSPSQAGTSHDPVLLGPPLIGAVIAAREAEAFTSMLARKL
jgi:hypothetical protein